MGVGTAVGSVVEGTISKDDMRTDSPLGGVVVGGDVWDVKESEDSVPVFQEAGGEPLPGFVGVDGSGEIEEPGLDPSSPSSESEPRITVPPPRQAIGVC